MFKPDIAVHFASNLRPHPKSFLDCITGLLESDVGLKGETLKEDLAIAFTLMNCFKGGNLKERFYASDPKERCVVFYSAKEMYDYVTTRVIIKHCVEVYRQIATANIVGGHTHELELRLMEDLQSTVSSRVRTEAFKDACDLIQKLIIAGHANRYHELSCHEVNFVGGDRAFVVRPTEKILKPGDTLELFKIQQVKKALQESGTVSQIAG